MKSRDRRRAVVLVNTVPAKESLHCLGTVFRAAGWDMKVCVIQYIKGQWKTGEQKPLSALIIVNVTLWAMVLPAGYQESGEDIKTKVGEIWELSKK